MKASRSLQLQLLQRVVGVALASSVVAGGLAYWVGHDRAEKAARQSVTQVAAAVARTAAIGAFTADTVLLREVTEGLLQHALVRRAEVVGADGQLLQSSPPAAASALRGGPVPPRELPPDWLAVDLVPPFRNAEVAGRLYLQLDASHVEAAARGQACLLAWAMAGQAALIALVLYLAVAGSVSRPIGQLARGLRVMLPGTANRLLPPPGHEEDEIGLLAMAANALLQANEDALARERRLRADLEGAESRCGQLQNLASVAVFVLDDDGLLLCSTKNLALVLGAAEQPVEALRGGEMAMRFSDPALVRAMLHAARTTGAVQERDLDTGDAMVRRVRLRLARRLPQRDVPEPDGGPAFDGMVHPLSPAG